MSAAPGHQPGYLVSMTTITSGDAGEATLGHRIRQNRLAAGLSARQLARDIGCSPSHISQVERGISEPSISVLTAIVSRLEVSMDSLLADSQDAPESPEPADTATSPQGVGHPGLQVQRSSEREQIRIQGGITSELLLPKTERNADFCEYRYEPGHSSNQEHELLRHPGREYGVVLEGQLCVRLKFEEFKLNVGDSIAFDSSIPHRFWNPGDVSTRAIWFSSPIL